MDFMPLIPFLGVSVPESLVLYYIALTLASRRESHLFLLIVSLLTSIFSYAIRLLPLIFGIHTFFQIILMVIFIHLFFHLQWRVAIIVIVLASVILGLAEGVFVPLLARIFSYSLEEIISDPLLRIVFTLPHITLLAGLTYISTKRGWRLSFLERMIKTVHIPKGKIFIGHNYLLVLSLVQALMLVLLNMSFYIYKADVYPSFTLTTLVVISSIVITVSALITILVAGYFLKLTEREARLETELRHVREMHNLNLKMQIQRHDFYNHLTAIYGYLKSNQFRQAQSYIKTIYESVRQTEKLLRLNPPELGSLLSVKQEEAKDRGIEFHWQVKIESGELPLSPEDFTQLTGNLLDNALEAAASSNTPRVDLTLTGNKIGLQLKVSNNGAPIPEVIRHKIFTAGYTTKDASRHCGLGLFIIKQIVERYGGQLDLVEPDNYQGVKFVIFIPWNGNN